MLNWNAQKGICQIFLHQRPTHNMISCDLLNKIILVTWQGLGCPGGSILSLTKKSHTFPPPCSAHPMASVYFNWENTLESVYSWLTISLAAPRLFSTENGHLLRHSPSLKVTRHRKKWLACCLSHSGVLGEDQLATHTGTSSRCLIVY